MGALHAPPRAISILQEFQFLFSDFLLQAERWESKKAVLKLEVALAALLQLFKTSHFTSSRRCQC